MPFTKHDSHIIFRKLFIYKEKTFQLKWPIKPKVIVTAISEFDEIFKFWSAEKIEKVQNILYFNMGLPWKSYSF